jgi:hypothetical protein
VISINDHAGGESMLDKLEKIEAERQRLMREKERLTAECKRLRLENEKLRKLLVEIKR